MLSEYKHSLTFRVRAMLSQQRNPCTDYKSTQWCTTRGHSLPFPTYIRVRAVVWECGEGQTDTQTDTETHRRPCHYRFCVVYDTREM